jgi:hypothetical protein
MTDVPSTGEADATMVTSKSLAERRDTLRLIARARNRSIEFSSHLEALISSCRPCQAIRA